VQLRWLQSSRAEYTELTAYDDLYRHVFGNENFVLCKDTKSITEPLSEDNPQYFQYVRYLSASGC
jgi:hypothetical protein